MRRSFLFALLAIVVLILVAASFYLDNLQKQLPASSTSRNESAPPIQIARGCGKLEVFVLNVSQADSIFIVTPGNRTILIDAGSGMKQNSSSNVLAFLKRMNVTKIDYALASHYHEDHIGGMGDVIKGYDIGRIYENGNCGNLTTATAKALHALVLLKGSTVVRTPVDLPSDGCLTEAKLIFPYNQKNGCSKSNENDNSVLLHLAYGNTSFLFTGDCDENCEDAIMAQGVSLKSDFLKVGHHGSYTSSSPAFLGAVSAKFYAISADKARSISDGYYHPREITLERLYFRSPSGVYRTDLNGDIHAESDGSRVSVFPSTQAAQCSIFAGYVSSDASSYSVIPFLSSICN